MGLLRTLSTGFLIESAGKAVGHIASGLNSRADAGKGEASMPAPDIHVEVQAGHAGELRELTCPHCNASVQAPAGRSVVYCMYCGSQLHYDDGSVSVTYRAVDEGRLREAEMKNALELRKLEIEEKRRPGRIKASIVLAIVGVAMMAIGAAAEQADPGSAWALFGLLGYFPLLAIVWIWIVAKDQDGGDD